VVPPNLPPAVSETLALVALYQPVRQSELVRERGSRVYDHVRLLVERRLLQRVRRGASYVLRTTEEFASEFGIPNDADAIRRAFASLWPTGAQDFARRWRERFRLEPGNAPDLDDAEAQEALARAAADFEAWALGTDSARGEEGPLGAPEVETPAPSPGVVVIERDLPDEESAETEATPPPAAAPPPRVVPPVETGGETMVPHRETPRAPVSREKSPTAPQTEAHLGDEEPAPRAPETDAVGRTFADLEKRVSSGEEEGVFFW
jgi:hypothetical protein